MSTSRRQFLRYAGLGTYAALQGFPSGAAPEFPVTRRKGKAPGFEPIASSAEDALRLPEGFRYDLLCTWNEPLGSNGPLGVERFGYNNDFLAFLPIDALSGGRSSADGLLWVNHEYPHPQFVSGYTGTGPKTEAQIIAEKLCVGGSVVHVRREAGRWKHLPGHQHARRFTALYPRMKVTGPASELVPEATGTLANCSGGVTPWNTVLSCEENFQDYNPVPSLTNPGGFRWSDVPAQKLDEREYGWVVEIDPFGELSPVKLSALGRFSHENAAWTLGTSGRLVVYMGDDAADQYLYKFVSADRYLASASRAERRRLLETGTLYAADFSKGRWIPLDLQRNKALVDAGFKSQGEVLLRAREAAAAVKATPIDRPEDCEVHPLDGSLYVALTNNTRHGNFYGQIVRLLEDGEDAASESFRFEIFLTGGPQSGLASPDNLAFDPKGNLWVVTDISSSGLNKGAYEGFGNNGLFVVPTSGASAGDAFQFASGPVDCELTGPWFTPNAGTLFLSVQHPGENSPSVTAPTSHWPDGGSAAPRPGVVAITGF
ncbi:MAG: PhoX family protein [Actinomycetota bacterium]